MEAIYKDVLLGEHKGIGTQLSAAKFFVLSLFEPEEKVEDG